jgi:hypothetical protein
MPGKSKENSVVVSLPESLSTVWERDRLGRFRRRRAADWSLDILDDRISLMAGAEAALPPPSAACAKKKLNCDTGRSGCDKVR